MLSWSSSSFPLALSHNMSFCSLHSALFTLPLSYTFLFSFLQSLSLMKEEFLSPFLVLQKPFISLLEWFFPSDTKDEEPSLLLNGHSGYAWSVSLSVGWDICRVLPEGISSLKRTTDSSWKAWKTDIMGVTNSKLCRLSSVTTCMLLYQPGHKLSSL